MDKSLSCFFDSRCTTTWSMAGRGKATFIIWFAFTVDYYPAEPTGNEWELASRSGRAFRHCLFGLIASNLPSPCRRQLITWTSGNRRRSTLAREKIYVRPQWLHGTSALLIRAASKSLALIHTSSSLTNERTVSFTLAAWIPRRKSANHAANITRFIFFCICQFKSRGQPAMALSALTKTYTYRRRPTVMFFLREYGNENRRFVAKMHDNASTRVLNFQKKNFRGWHPEPSSTRSSKISCKGSEWWRKEVTDLTKDERGHGWEGKVRGGMETLAVLDESLDFLLINFILTTTALFFH